MSSDVGRTVGAEVFKLWRLKSAFLLPIAVVAGAALEVMLFEVIERRTAVGPPNGYYIGAVSLAWLANVFALLAVVVTSFLISREFALGTVKSAWTRPVRREAWYAGKVFSAGLFVTTLYVLAAGAVVVVTLARVGLVDLVESNLVIHASDQLAMRLGVALALTAVSLWAVVCVTALIAAVVDNVGGAIAAGIGLGAVLGMIQLSATVRPFLLNTYVGAPMTQMMAMAKGLPTPWEWNTLVWQACACAGVWALVAYVAGRRLIGRRDVTG